VRELAARPWYGNVRELRNFVERARALGVEAALDLIGPEGTRRDHDLPPVDLTVPFKELRDVWIEHLEREYLRGMLNRFGGNVSAVAQAAGIDRTYVHRLMKKHGL
jgi:DNA-binding NtrC family response regulator